MAAPEEMEGPSSGYVRGVVSRGDPVADLRETENQREVR